MSAIILEIESFKPHLPIDSRHMRTSEVERLIFSAWFPCELIGLPGFPVLTSFDDDLGSSGGHHPEETIGIERSKDSDLLVHAKDPTR